MRKHVPIILAEVALFGGAGLMEALGFTLPLWVWAMLFAIGAGGLICWYGVIPLIARRTARAVAEPPSHAEPARSAIDGDAVKGLISSIVILGMFGGGVYGLTLVDWSRPNEIWAHPTLPADGQERVKAECRMRAQEAIQGGGIKDGARSLYAKDCMISEGFQRVPDDR